MGESGKPSRGRLLLRIGMVLAGIGAIVKGVTLIAPSLGASVAHAQLTMRELPGFRIAMPPGTDEHVELDYRVGQVQVTHVNDTGNVVRVQWEPGGMPEGEDSALLVRTLEHSTGTTARSDETAIPSPGGTTRLITLDGPDKTLFCAFVACGGRRVTVMAGADPDMESIERRMVASIDCHPDPALEAALSTLPWTIALPPGWFASDAPPGQVQLTDGNSLLFLQATGLDLSNTDLPRALTASFGSGGAQLTVGSWAGDRFPLQGSIGGQAVTGWARQVRCESSAVIVMALAVDSAAADDLAQLVATDGHCLRHGETPPPWPRR